MLRPMTTVLAGLALAAAAGTARAQQSVPGARETDSTFEWSGAIESGSWLRIRNLNGSIEVRPASGSTAQVRAEKHWRRGDPRQVHFALVRDGANVTICALWDEDDTCDAGGMHAHGHGHDRGDVSVRFTVELPNGVKIDAGTVNGGVDVRDAGAEVIAKTVNGHVDAVSRSGPVTASTVNGSVRAHMEALSGSGDLRYSTVNGSIVLEVPATLDAELDMRTVNGALSSDFPLIVTGRVNPRHLRATVGKGGRRIELSTVNGSIELRKTS
jgi:hypothetical protein